MGRTLSEDGIYVGMPFDLNMDNNELLKIRNKFWSEIKRHCMGVIQVDVEKVDLDLGPGLVVKISPFCMQKKTVTRLSASRKTIVQIEVSLGTDCSHFQVKVIEEDLFKRHFVSHEGLVEAIRYAFDTCCFPCSSQNRAIMFPMIAD